MSWNEMEKLSFEEISKKIIEICNDQEEKLDIKKAMGVTPQVFSNWKSRGVFPLEQLWNFCIKYNINLRWLYFGIGNKDVEEMHHPGAKDIEKQLDDLLERLQKFYLYNLNQIIIIQNTAHR